MDNKKISNLNEDTIRRIVVEPKNDESFLAMEKIVANLSKDKEFLTAIELLKKCLVFIDLMKFKFGENIDESALEKRISEYLKKVEKTIDFKSRKNVH